MAEKGTRTVIRSTWILWTSAPMSCLNALIFDVLIEQENLECYCQHFQRSFFCLCYQGPSCRQRWASDGLSRISFQTRTYERSCEDGSSYGAQAFPFDSNSYGVTEPITEGLDAQLVARMHRVIPGELVPRVRCLDLIQIVKCLYFQSVLVAHRGLHRRLFNYRIGN